jgi:DNA-directed RNA polymerase specialized sigma24 family protein
VTTEPDLLAAAFSRARPRLVRVAYAIIGSHSDAEDVVADCWFRLVAADKDKPVRDVEAWAPAERTAFVLHDLFGWSGVTR